MDNRQSRFSLFFVLAAALLLAGCSRRSRFAAAERAFHDAAACQTALLDSVLGSYAGADARRIGTLHAGYLHDGTFALLDSLDAGMVSHLERMQAACTRREVPRMVVCLTLHFRLSRRLTDVEIPFVYRRFPPPWEYLEPDAATRLGTDR